MADLRNRAVTLLASAAAAAGRTPRRTGPAVISLSNTAASAGMSWTAV